MRSHVAIACMLGGVGIAWALSGWLVPQAELASWMRHPVRVDADVASIDAAAWARWGWTAGGLVLAALPWVLAPGRPPADAAPEDRRFLFLAMAMALALRFHFAGQGLWYDEIASASTYVVHGPGVIVGNAFTTANHPLQSLLSWCAMPLGVEPWIRLPSMLSGVAAVLGAWWIGRATRDGTWLASAMAIAMAILPASVNAGGEARGYGLMIAASALSTGLLLMALRHGSSWRWIAYAIVLALGVWAHFVTAMVGAGHAVIALWMLRNAAERSAAGRILRAVCAAGLLAMALWSPALPDLMRTRGQFVAIRGDEPSLLGTQGLLLLWQLAGMTPLPMHRASVDETRALLTAVPAAVLLAIGWATSLRDGPLRRALAFAASGLPITVLLAWVGGSWLYARFLLFALPATALLLAVGSRGLIDATATGRQALSLRIARSLVVPLAIASCLAYDLGSQPRQPIREAVAQVADLRGPGDRVLGVGIADDVVQWYALAFKVPVESTGIGGGGLPATLASDDAEWIIALYPGHRHPEASADALSARGFRRRPPHGHEGWLDAGEGTVEIWCREQGP